MKPIEKKKQKTTTKKYGRLDVGLQLTQKLQAVLENFTINPLAVVCDPHMQLLYMSTAKEPIVALNQKNDWWENVMCYKMSELWNTNTHKDSWKHTTEFRFKLFWWYTDTRTIPVAWWRFQGPALACHKTLALSIMWCWRNACWGKNQKKIWSRKCRDILVVEADVAETSWLATLLCCRYCCQACCYIITTSITTEHRTAFVHWIRAWMAGQVGRGDRGVLVWWEAECWWC